ncbi:FixH family protein [Sulfurospirillum halorespirans]|uniref:YtkA-like protein n=1 Tax=Sulfurospirillum halorespirans DSM 13726 TaxID=1193502 RepID=A0A1D7TNM7_9BACT|nr:FixH family protein [Sulfurospirillum halorespirans]AOO66595.1 YtkA-like protein [Sulfurospirillum halorespirans DSM 13726]
MKKILGMFLAVALSLGSLYAAEALSKKGMAGPLEVEYSTLKPVSQGMNLIKVKVKEGAKEVKDAKVSIITLMPAMPGMPAMEEKAEAVYKEGAYEANVVFAMNGTWQLSIVVETADGKKQRLKSSVNF